ncbi:MAG: YcxB family protein [Acetobacteraceae bacterium]
MADRVSYELKLEDFAAFSVFAVMRRNRGRAMFGGAGPVLGGALVLTALFAAWNLLSGVELLVAIVSPAIVFLPIAVVFMLVVRPTYRRQMRAMLAAMSEPDEREELLGPKLLSWDAGGLTQRGPLGHWHLSWPAITAVEETEDHLFVMAGGLNGLFIPKRDVPAADGAALTAAIARATGLSPVAAKL